MGRVNLYQVLVTANAIIGGLLVSGGALTAYAGAFGQDHRVALVLAGLGVLQLVSANIIHAVISSGQSAPPTQPPAAPSAGS